MSSVASWQSAVCVVLGTAPGDTEFKGMVAEKLPQDWAPLEAK